MLLFFFLFFFQETDLIQYKSFLNYIPKNINSFQLDEKSIDGNFFYDENSIAFSKLKVNYVNKKKEEIRVEISQTFYFVSQKSSINYYLADTKTDNPTTYEKTYSYKNLYRCLEVLSKESNKAPSYIKIWLNKAIQIEIFSQNKKSIYELLEKIKLVDLSKL
jgi:hypothetical protein